MAFKPKPTPSLADMDDDGAPPAFGKGGAPADEAGDDDADLEVEAGELLDAIKANNPAAVASAFKRMHEMCADAPSEDEGGEDDDGAYLDFDEEG